MTRGIVLLPLIICLVTALPAVFIPTALSALGGREKDTVVEVTGRVRLVGSAPLYELVITARDMEWYVAKEDERKLFDYQQRIVTVEGTETVTTLTFANGFPAGERRTLKNIKIISVE